jgi:hypothetical protein
MTPGAYPPDKIAHFKHELFAFDNTHSTALSQTRAANYKIAALGVTEVNFLVGPGTRKAFR